MDLELHGVILPEEVERGLHPLDGQDLSMEQDKARASVDRSADDCATKTERLSRQVM
jgi:hypothetical protein